MPSYFCADLSCRPTVCASERRGPALGGATVSLSGCVIAWSRTPSSCTLHFPPFNEAYNFISLFKPAYLSCSVIYRNVPKLPSWNPFFSLRNEDQVTKRMKGLQEFLDK